MAKWNNDQTYTEIKGRALDIVPKALENGGSFLTMAQAMDRRAVVVKSRNQELIDTWFGNGFLTMTPVFYDMDGNVAIGDINDAKVMNYIKNITPALDGKLYNGRMVLSDEFRITDIDGEMFRRNKIEKYGNHLMSEKDAKKNPVWRALADNNQARLDGYVEQVYKLAKDKYNKTELMGVWFSDSFEKNNMGLFWLGSLGNYFNSYAIGSLNLDLLNNYYFGRVVRVQAPEAQVRAPQETKGLEKTIVTGPTADAMYSNLKKFVPEVNQQEFLKTLQEQYK